VPDTKTSSDPLKIEYLLVSELKPNPRNPRQHSPAQVAKIAKSMEQFGCVVPFLTDSKSQIVSGHGRLLAAHKLKMTCVPVVRLEHLSEAQLRAFSIADNRLTEISVWDDRLLGEELKTLSDLNLDFGLLEATGFEVGEIDFRIESLNDTQAAGQIENEPLPVPGPAVTRPGDLWELGSHRVFCGNALEPKSFAQLMTNQKAAMVFTDAPYNVRVDGHVSGLGAVKHREFAMACGEMDSQQFTRFLRSAFELLKKNSLDGSLHFYCMDWRHTPEIIAATQDLLVPVNLCVWKKNNAGMGSLYRSQHELVWTYKNGKTQHRNNVALGKNGRHRTNVWEYPSATTFGRTSEEGPLFKLHPTVKPVRLVADAILDCTSRRDVVLDSFLGSGTSLIAAERTGRRCYGVEIDPLYVDLIVRRWQAYTGSRARHAVTRAAFHSRQGGIDHVG
jgi:DNA modification methylase